MSPARNYPEETFVPPGLDVSAAKKSLKSKKKRISKKNKSKSANSPPSDSSDKSSSDQDVISIPEVSVKSGTSDKSGSDEDVILISQDSAEAVITSKKTQYSIFDISISEDSEDAANADSTQNQEEQLSDDHDNDEIVKEPSDNVEDVSRQHIVEDSGDVNIHTNENQLSDDPDNDGGDDKMESQDSEKSTTHEQIQDEDVNPADMEAVGSDNEYERQENYLCVQCMTYFWSKEELDKHEISTHLSYYPQEENFPDVSGNENIETDVDKENLSDHSEICRKLFVLVIKKMIIKRVVASLSSDVIMSNIFILNVKTDPQNPENAQHDLIEFLYSLKEDIMMDIRNVSYINILENMLIYAENPSVTLPCKIFEDMSLSEIFTVFNSNGINIPPHSLCESVLNRSNEEEEIVSRPSLSLIHI